MSEATTVELVRAPNGDPELKCYQIGAQVMQFSKLYEIVERRRRRGGTVRVYGKFIGHITR